MSYKYKEPPNYDDVIWLEVVGNEIQSYVPQMGIGDITWVEPCYKKNLSGTPRDTIHPEENRWHVNIPPGIFRIIPTPNIIGQKRYRIKTKEEFIRDGDWDYDYGTPSKWESKGKMNKYLGMTLNHRHHNDCDDNRRFTINDGQDVWTIFESNYVEIEPSLDYIPEFHAFAEDTNLCETLPFSGREDFTPMININ